MYVTDGQWAPHYVGPTYIINRWDPGACPLQITICIIPAQFLTGLFGMNFVDDKGDPGPSFVFCLFLCLLSFADGLRCWLPSLCLSPSVLCVSVAQRFHFWCGSTGVSATPLSTSSHAVCCVSLRARLLGHVKVSFWMHPRGRDRYKAFWILSVVTSVMLWGLVSKYSRTV